MCCKSARKVGPRSKNGSRSLWRNQSQRRSQINFAPKRNIARVIMASEESIATKPCSSGCGDCARNLPTNEGFPHTSSSLTFHFDKWRGIIRQLKPSLRASMALESASWRTLESYLSTRLPVTCATTRGRLSDPELDPRLMQITWITRKVLGVV